MRVRPDEHVVAERRRVAGAAADQRVLHHDALAADLDRAALGGQHRAEQDARVLADGHVAAEHRGRRDVGGLGDGGTATFVLDQHHPAILRPRSGSFPDVMRIEGSKVLLTGATGGIGQAIARALHARGAQLILTGRRMDVLDRLQEDLGGDHRQLPVDLADAQSAAGLADVAGEVDVLVANAALPASGPIEGFTAEEVDRAIDVNLRVPIQLARDLVPGMVERGQGQLVFISSLSGKVGTNGSALYSATKFGLRGLAQGMREDLHGTGVGVTVVNPGFVREAGMFAESGVALPKFVGTTTPERVAEAVLAGIEKDRGEIDVAPLGVRLGTRFGMFAPRLSSGVQRRFGAEKIASAIAEGQKDKR